MNIRLTLEYDGADFSGWARQPGLRTVEGELRSALDRLYASWDGLAVAGRTDAGVHALGQVVSFEADGGPPTDRAADALNTLLPNDVAAVSAATAPAGFHARFSATGRAYRYLLLTRPHRSALERRRVLWWPKPVDLAMLEAAAEAVVGTHDFTAFTPAETQHTVFVREVREARWERSSDQLRFTIAGDSFLRHMVRTLVGTMLDGIDIAPLLAGADRSAAGRTAPPHGLYLERVEYVDDELADAFLEGRLTRPVTSVERVRIAVVVLRRLGPAGGRAAVRDGLLKPSDEQLVARRLDRIEAAMSGSPLCSIDDLIRAHPELLESDPEA